MMTLPPTPEGHPRDHESCVSTREPGERIAARRRCPYRRSTSKSSDSWRPVAPIAWPLLAVVGGLGKAFFTGTTYQGVPGARAAFSSWRTTADDVDIAWRALEEAAASV